MPHVNEWLTNTDAMHKRIALFKHMTTPTSIDKREINIGHVVRVFINNTCRYFEVEHLAVVQADLTRAFIIGVCAFFHSATTNNTHRLPHSEVARW